MRRAIVFISAAALSAAAIAVVPMISIVGSTGFMN